MKLGRQRVKALGYILLHDSNVSRFATIHSCYIQQTTETSNDNSGIIAMQLQRSAKIDTRMLESDCVIVIIIWLKNSGFHSAFYCIAPFNF